MTQRDGRRWSAADAYLHPAARQPNLTVLTDARVTRLVIEAGRAAGVRYLRRGREETARADAEVILAAGAIGSPHLLMLSGIGPADHLHEHDITSSRTTPPWARTCPITRSSPRCGTPRAARACGRRPPR